MKDSKKSQNFMIVWIITGALIVLTGLLIFFFVSYSKTLGKSEKEELYKRYYAFITNDTESSFWDSVYLSSVEEGLKEDSYVEMISKNLSKEYSEKELMEIAIASGVDGIIVYGDESAEMKNLIDKAYSKNIPVVTMYSDNTQSERLSFVGIGNYDLGKEYGNLIIDMVNTKTFVKDTIRVTVVIDANSEDAGQNVLFSAIQETVEKENRENKYNHAPIEVSLFPVDSTNSFSVEEAVKGLLVRKEEELPDIVVCLNEMATTSVYQTVVDYNKVGFVNILGYHDSDAILKGIERGVIFATVSIDTTEMGQYCVDALNEYYNLGNTSQYFSVDISVINQKNVNKYMKGESDEN